MMNRFFGGGFNGFGRCFGGGLGRGAGFMHFGWMFMVVGAVILIALLFYIIVHNKKKKAVSSEALELLKLKFAKGEITEEEYLRRREILIND